MNNTKNYYELLEVGPKASAEEIRKSYISMMFHRRYHPDLGGDSVVAKELNVAYETLMDPKLREDHDKKLQAGDWIGKIFKSDEKERESRNHMRCPKCTAFNSIKRGDDDHKCVLCGTPIKKATIEARRKIRYPFSSRVKIAETSGGIVYEAKAIDLSDSGIRFISFQKLNRGKILCITSDEFTAFGRIAWVKERNQLFRPAYEIGVRFDSFESWDHSFLLQATA